MTSPSEAVTLVAAVTGGSADKIVFYRNDVPYKTFDSPSSPQSLTEDELGQDSYTYKVRAYDGNGDYVESDEISFKVDTPRVFVMGVDGSTSGPNISVDHTEDIREAIEELQSYLYKPGGTIYFPCPQPLVGGGPGRDVAIYNIRDTIVIPSNITLQGESAEAETGRCQMLWRDIAWNPDYDQTPPIDNCHINVDPDPNDSINLLNKPMFQIEGETSKVRFRDLWLYSRASGPYCWPRYDWDQVRDENTVGIGIYGKDNEEKISDVILENVSISNFTHGVKAVSCTNPNFNVDDPAASEPEVCDPTDTEIFDIKMRGYRPSGNHRQLFIDSANAYTWDVQNLNISAMMTSQGAVEIRNAGSPAEPETEDTKLKFMQLNCNGSRAFEPGFCVDVKKHGGLYFKMLHHEAVPNAIRVYDISGNTPPNDTNEEPIVFENSVLDGDFHDASMKLYTIASHLVAAPDEATAGQDAGRLRFYGDGAQSTVIDCGDVHWDRTDTQFMESPTPSPVTTWSDLRMLFTHSERSRSSFFWIDGGEIYNMKHSNCIAGDEELPDVDKIGGEHFDTGVMPTDAVAEEFVTVNTTNCSNAATCAAFIEQKLAENKTISVEGALQVQDRIRIPTGSQIIGKQGASITWVSGGSSSQTTLFELTAPIGTTTRDRNSGYVIRNLALVTGLSGKTGIKIVGETGGTGVMSDVHFSGLTVQGFDIGFDAGANAPMIDGVSLKNLNFVNNQTAIKIQSPNASNWNIVNLRMESNRTNSIGLDQQTGGHAIQNVFCKGVTNAMKDCINILMGATYLTGFKRADNVVNALSVEPASLVNGSEPWRAYQASFLVLRNNDFTDAAVNIEGKSFITSMNNIYTEFDGSTQTSDNVDGVSRITYCNDTYPTPSPTPKHFPLVEDYGNNRFTGVLTPSRVACGKSPMLWEDVVRWGGEEGDVPLVGRFYDDDQEDYVIYRPGTSGNSWASYFRIKRFGYTTDKEIIQWGQGGSSSGADPDVPLVGDFFPNTRSQIGIWRPGNGEWWIWDPNTDSQSVWTWGSGAVHDDRPFVGNFLDEEDAPTVVGNHDEIAVYRPASGYLYILNPRNGSLGYVAVPTGITDDPNDPEVSIQVADFLGLGYEQVALVKNGEWDVFDPRNPSTNYTAFTFTDTGAVPVSGMFLTPAGSPYPPCAQVGYWVPGTQQFVVKDTPLASCPTGRGTKSMYWGSNNDSLYTGETSCPGGNCPNDIPLSISTSDGALRRPTAYRPTRGVYVEAVINGQWFVHDPF